MRTKRARLHGLPDTAAMLLVACLLPACDGLVGASIECEKICITAAGPTVSGLAIPADAGVPDGLPPQGAGMEFNVPLAQLSGAVAEVDVEAYLSSLRLMSQADLAFVESARITLRAGSRDGGVFPADASGAGSAPALGPNATVSVGAPPASVDGGSMPALDDLPSLSTSSCAPGGPGLVVANYQKPTNATSSVGQSIELAPSTREADLYRCLREAPARFAVDLTVAPAYLPAAPATVSLRVCIRARASASYP